MATEAGVVVGIGEQVFFTPATNVRIVSEQPTVTAVPSTSLGMTLIDGHVVPVVTVGQSRGPLLLCDESGDTVALAGLVILSTGTYPLEDGRVVVGGSPVARLDVASRVLAAAGAPQPPAVE
jgi:hypothetical protein